VRLKLVRVPKGVNLQVGFVGLSRYHAQQNAEFGIAVILKALREVGGRNIRPTRVGVMQGRASNLRKFERFYGCPVEFRASSDFLEFSAQTLALPLVTEDPNLLETLKPICDAASRERRTRKGTLRASVENDAKSTAARRHSQAEHSESARYQLANALAQTSRRRCDLR
jgi:hypothetical protein